MLQLGYPLPHHLGHGLILWLRRLFGLHRRLLFLCLDRCNIFLDFLHVLLLWLLLLLQPFLLPWLFLNNTTMRWNILNLNLISYLKTWSKLEGTPFSVDVEHDLRLANINSSSHGLEERPPKDE
jgi:hypothetical protein